MRKCWSKEEIDFLTKLYITDGLSVTELYPTFNEKFNRTKTAIQVKIGKLRLKHTEKQISDIKSRIFSGEKNGMYGKSSSLKGLTKETSEMIRMRSEKTSKTRKKMYEDGLLPDLNGKNNPMYGIEAWNKGKNKYIDKRIYEYGLKVSKAKIKWWENLSKNEKEVVIDRLNKVMIQNNKVTKIEKIINDFLVKNDVLFETNKKIGRFYVDFYLAEYNLVIECDGDYWHANPMFYKKEDLTETQIKNIDRDKRKEKMLYDKSINILRFWEHDIIYKFKFVKERIWEQLQKK